MPISSHYANVVGQNTIANGPLDTLSGLVSEGRHLRCEKSRGGAALREIGGVKSNTKPIRWGKKMLTSTNCVSRKKHSFRFLIEFCKGLLKDIIKSIIILNDWRFMDCFIEKEQRRSWNVSTFYLAILRWRVLSSTRFWCLWRSTFMA